MISYPYKKPATLSTLIHDLDGIFSRFIRLRDTRNGKIKCFICGAVMTFHEAQCGHFIDRDQMSTRYDEMNCHSICENCNCFDDHHKERYEQKLRTIITPEGMDHLWQKSRGLQKFMRYEVEELIQHYTMRNKELKK